MADEWQVVRAALVSIAQRRCVLDAEEMRAIRRALEIEVWKPFGMVSIVDYLERVVGYAPRTAADRVRVAIELRELTQIECALERGEICYSAAREVSRVAVKSTETEWLAAIEGRNLREIEVMTRGRGQRAAERSGRAVGDDAQAVARSAARGVRALAAGLRGGQR